MNKSDLVSRLTARLDGDRKAVVPAVNGVLEEIQQSLARGVGDMFGGGGTHQVIVELARLWLFVTAAGNGTHLAVIAAQEVDAEVMAVAMHTLVLQVGRHMGTAARTMPKEEGVNVGEPLGRRTP